MAYMTDLQIAQYEIMKGYKAQVIKTRHAVRQDYNLDSEYARGRCAGWFDAAIAAGISTDEINKMLDETISEAIDAENASKLQV